jgi:hypothetical protein
MLTTSFMFWFLFPLILILRPTLDKNDLILLKLVSPHCRDYDHLFNRVLVGKP